MKYSIIVPVYNRIDEVRDLLDSLSKQTFKDFELMLVEDGSTAPCQEAVKEYENLVDIKYHFKNNEGRSIARNYGLERASGQYFIFFDSDCVIPENYFEILDKHLSEHPLDCFGGPDAAHQSFSNTQKAINYTMTSFITTGGIRGGKVQLEKFTPRTFNMGFSRKVYQRVGGFREMFSEDIDMSTRIRNAGFSIGLIRDAYVWHKRRVDMRKFLRQVYVFGMSRITLKQLYPGSLKAVHCLPALFLLGSVALIVLAIVVKWWLILPLPFFFFMVFIGALFSTHSLSISLKAILASAIQLYGYGAGFIKAFCTNILTGRGRDINKEIEMRRGK